MLLILCIIAQTIKMPLFFKIKQGNINFPEITKNRRALPLLIFDPPGVETREPFLRKQY